MTIFLFLKVDLSDSENEFEQNGVDADHGGGLGGADSAACGGTSSG